jgi:hypothetical protein
MKNRWQKSMRLQDVVRIVSQFARNDRETSLAVADLLNRRVVRLRGSYAHCRVIVR